MPSRVPKAALTSHPERAAWIAQAIWSATVSSSAVSPRTTEELSPSKGENWGGAAAWLYAQDQTGWAIFMVVYGVAVISSVDPIMGEVDR